MSLTIPLGGTALSTGLSGIRAAQVNLDTRAHNIANAQTLGFQRQTVVQTAQAGLGGVNTEIRREPASAGTLGQDLNPNLANDLIGQRMSLYSFSANLKVVETQHDVLGTLLDTQA